MGKRKYEPTPMGDKQFYVYELRYPEGFVDRGVDLSDVIFYIGKGKVKKQGLQRADEHEAIARSSITSEKIWGKPYYTDPKNDAIRRVWHQGKQVKKCIAFETDDEPEAFAFETAHIARNITIYLTNVKDAGPAKNRAQRSGWLW